MTIRVDTDIAALILFVALTLVLFGATLRTLYDAIRNRH